MIDFRYHLISIVAVLLALAIGIFAGSGFLGGPLLDDLRGRIKSVKTTNDKVRSQNDDLKGQLRQADDFTEAVEPLLIDQSLTGRRLVIVQLEGSNQDAADGLRDELERAGGVVASRITFTNKLALEETTDREQLALIVESAAERPGELRIAAAEKFGSGAASAGAFAGGEPRGASAAAARFDALVDQLERAGFVSVEQLEGAEPVPPGSDFVIAGGGGEPASYDAGAFVTALGTEIAQRGNPVIVTEPSDSVWGLSTAVRDDPDAEAAVATVDYAETPPGRIATVLGLVALRRGEAGHYGTGPGADGLVPTPSPGG